MSLRTRRTATHATLDLARAIARRAGGAALSRIGLQPIDRRATVWAALERLQLTGIAPATVVDVGAAYGRWSHRCARTFPSARYVLVDPLDEFAPFIEDVATRLHGAVAVHAALADVHGRRVLKVHADLVGSSLLDEADENLLTTARDVDVTTVDRLVIEHQLAPPFLLKIDAQGAELDVLRGAADTLADTCAIVVETAILPFFDKDGGFAELTNFLALAGFVLHDLADLTYRPGDSALAQVDAVFVTAESAARADRTYADAEKRSAQDRQFALAYRYRRSRLYRRSPST